MIAISTLSQSYEIINNYCLILNSWSTDYDVILIFNINRFIIDQGWDLSQIWTYLAYTPLKATRDAVNALTLAIIIIVVAVPEGLPTMIAIVLSLNMRRLLKNQVSDVVRQVMLFLQISGDY
jgi:hypothetical protein